MSIISENTIKVLENIKSAAEKSGRLAEDIQLVGVTKYSEADAINQAIDAGLKIIGENRVQELMRKNDEINPSAKRHIIGHLQTNKAKYIVGKVDLIQSVDSFKLADEINRLSSEIDVISNVLIQVNIAKEQQKYGVYEENLEELLEQITHLDRIKVCGLMMIPPLMLQPDYDRVNFSKMYKLFIDIASKKQDNVSMDILSMGMSGDYEIAIEEGSNMVRVGSAIFR